MTRFNWVRISLFMACFVSASVGIISKARADVEPSGAGPFKVVCASWLGGPGADTLVAANILPDGTLLLGGNSDGLKLPGIEPAKLRSTSAAPPPISPDPSDKKTKSNKSDGSDGFLVHLSADGQRVIGAADSAGVKIVKVKLDGQGVPYLLGESTAEIKIAGTQGTGRFIARLSADATRIETAIFHEKDLYDFAVDSNGEILVLSPGKITRYAIDGKSEKWTATYSSYGDNRPGGIAVDAKSGVAAVTGYGMTQTGHQPYKDPYGYGFSREGKQVWAIWNPDPTRECDTKFGGNGLMADTTGRGAGAGADGKIYFILYADGGNTVCGRDPLNPDNPQDPQVMDGVHQKGPGFGFKGASKTSVIFRIDPTTGKLEKGTWLSAWLTPARANSLGMSATDADEAGNTFVVGDSASGCPTKDPWYTAPPGGYQGGGYLAIFDKNFKLTQCGFFPGSGIKSVAYRNGTLVIAGSAINENKAKDLGNANGPETTYPVPTFHPVQKDFGGGEKDGYFVILKATK